MVPKIFLDHNKVELMVDSVFLKCAIDTVFTAVSKSIESQIVTVI